MPIKPFLRFRIPGKEIGGYDLMQDDTKGLYTYLEHILGESVLGLISLASPGIAILPEYVGPVLNNWAKYFVNLSKGKSQSS